MTESQEQHYVLEEQVGYLLRLANQRHLSIFAEHIVDGLTSVQFSTLFRLRKEAGPMSQNALGRLVGMDAATTKGVVSRLISRGLIQMEKDPTDKRRYMLSTTQKGRALIEDTLPRVQQISEDTLAPLTPHEAKQFVDLLKKLT